MRHVNPRQMKKAMQQMGIKPVEINASEVVIKCPNKDIIISSPKSPDSRLQNKLFFRLLETSKKKSRRKVEKKKFHKQIYN